MINDDIIRLAILLADEISPEQRHQLRSGIHDTDLALADSVVALIWGDALPVGVAHADRLRDIATEMGGKVTEAQGYFWADLPERVA